MAKNTRKTNIKKAKKEIKKEKKQNEGIMKNPIYTLWGKIIIIVLAVAMAAASLATLIWILVEQFNKV